MRNISSSQIQQRDIGPLVAHLPGDLLDGGLMAQGLPRREGGQSL